jgi:phosphate:Na+ symporter
VDVFVVLLKILGGLGVFLFGMKLMSEALQRVAGQRLKRLLATITANRFSGVLTGLSMTAIVQSSSATTVMVVGFVNAQLLTLHQAIGVIMGANIGTTITGWLVALLGFKVSISSFALPAIAVGFFMGFVRHARTRELGETLVGFGLLFLGLALMKDQVPAIDAADVTWVTSLSRHGVLSTLLFVAIGTGLTVVLQSSSATMALTLTLTAAGSIPYEMAAAMILGENIGTTITANLAAIGTSTAAKRAARAHLLFNIFGVIWAVALMDAALLGAIDALVPGDPTLGDKGVVTAHLAAFHTLFNVVNTAMLLPFVDRIAAIVTRLTPDRAVATGRMAHFVTTTLVQTPEALFVQVRKEMERMAGVVIAMYADAVTVLRQPDASLGSLVEQTLEREDLVDGLEREITEALAFATRGDLSAEAAAEVAVLAINAHRLERIGDHCEKLVGLAIANHQAGEEHRFSSVGLAHIEQLVAVVDQALDCLRRYLLKCDAAVVAEADRIEAAVDALRDQLVATNVAWMQEKASRLVSGLRLVDTLHQLEEIADRAYGIIKRAEDLRASTS